MASTQELGIPEDLDHILMEGATLQAYRTGGGLATARFVGGESQELLGYGVDTSVESALSLACGSYAVRELEYADCVDLNHPDAIYDDFRVPELITSVVPRSRLDSFIGTRTGMCAERDGDEVVAWTWNLDKDQGSRGDTLQAATQALLINSVKLH